MWSEYHVNCKKKRFARSLSEKQIADIIRTSAKRPDVKKRNIDSAAKKLIDSSYELAKVRIGFISL